MEVSCTHIADRNSEIARTDSCSWLVSSAVATSRVILCLRMTTELRVDTYSLSGCVPPPPSPRSPNEENSLSGDTIALLSKEAFSSLVDAVVEELNELGQGYRMTQTWCM